MQLIRRREACIVLVGAYVALRLAIYAVPGALNPLLAVLLSIAVVMLVQLALVVSIAGQQMKPGRSALLALSSALLFAGCMILLPKVGDAAPAAFELSLGILQDLLLMMFAAFLGYTISFIVREPNILLPAAVFAGFVDYWSVSWGPLSRVLEERPAVVEAVSVQMPTSVPGIPGAMIGMGDFVFLALFFGILYRFDLNVKGAFWLGYALLTVSMLIVLQFGGALPALVPMAIAILAANIRHLKLRREELLATLYVAAMLLALLVASGIYLSRR